MCFKPEVNVAFSIADGCTTDCHPLVLLIMYFRSLVLIKTVALVSKKNQLKHYSTYVVFTFKKKILLLYQIRSGPI